MSAEYNKAVKQDENQNKKQTIDTSRRSFAKAGVVAPVIMTLASKPVLGGNWDLACSYSGNMSGNASHPDEGTCEGCTPGFWKNHPSLWPSGYVPASCTVPVTQGQYGKCKNAQGAESDYDLSTGTKFGTIFGFGYRGSVEQDNTTMIALIDNPQGEWTLHAHAIAAVLNAATTSINFGNTVSDIIKWWQDTSISDLDLKNRYAMLNERVCPLPGTTA